MVDSYVNFNYRFSEENVTACYIEYEGCADDSKIEELQSTSVVNSQSMNIYQTFFVWGTFREVVIKFIYVPVFDNGEDLINSRIYSQIKELISMINIVLNMQ